MSKIIYQTATRTETGSAHEHNSDASLNISIPDGHLLAVADGHNGKNGHAALASKMVIEQLKKYFNDRTYTDFTKALTNAITFSNYSLWELIQKDEKYQGIAATLAVLVIYNDKAYYAYAGDSRVYWWHNNELQPLTRDHVKPTEPGSEKLEVINLLGKEKDIRFGINKNPLLVQPGDLFFVSTDGLTDTLTDSEIAEIIGDSDTSPEHKCLLLSNKVKEKGGTENTTIQILEILPEFKPAPKKMKHLLTILFAAVMVLAVGYTSYLVYAKFVNAPAKNDAREELLSEHLKSETEKNGYSQELSTDEGITETQPENDPDDRQTSQHSNQATKKQVLPEPKKEVIQAEPKKEKVKESSTPKMEQTKRTSESTAKKETTSSTTTKGIIHLHKIQSGENLYRISLRYHVSQQKLTELNGDKASRFVAGQELKIPVTALHKVETGDQLKAIAIKYNVPLNLILTANKMDAQSVLKNGSTLIIPLR